MNPTSYEQSFPFSGDARRALDAAAASLTAAGMRVANTTDDRVEATSPGYRASAASWLRAFSTLTVRIDAGNLTLIGDLGALRRRDKSMQLILLMVVGGQLIIWEILARKGYQLLAQLVAVGISISAAIYIFVQLRANSIGRFRAERAAQTLAHDVIAASTPQGA